MLSEASIEFKTLASTSLLKLWSLGYDTDVLRISLFLFFSPNIYKYYLIASTIKEYLLLSSNYHFVIKNFRYSIEKKDYFKFITFTFT